MDAVTANETSSKISLGNVALALTILVGSVLIVAGIVPATAPLAIVGGLLFAVSSLAWAIMHPSALKAYGDMYAEAHLR